LINCCPPSWGIETPEKIPRMGEVVSDWNSDGVFVGGESLTIQVKKMKLRKRTDKKMATA